MAQGISKGDGWAASYQAKRKELKANKILSKDKFRTVVSPADYSKVSKNLGKMEQALSDDDLGAKAMGLRKLNEELAEGIITEKEAAEGYVKLGGTLQELEVPAEKIIWNFKDIG